MKIVLILFVISGCSYAGFGVSKNFKSKVNFYHDMLLFCSGLKCDLSFLKLRLDNVFAKATGGKEFVFLCEKATQSLKSAKSQLIQYKDLDEIVFLSKKEKQTLYGFFDVLGKSDVANQQMQIDGYEKIFFDCLENAKQEYKTKGALYGKLGIYAGLFVAILCL